MPSNGEFYAVIGLEIIYFGKKNSVGISTQAFVCSERLCIFVGVGGPATAFSDVFSPLFAYLLHRFKSLSLDGSSYNAREIF